MVVRAAPPTACLQGGGALPLSTASHGPCPFRSSSTPFLCSPSPLFKNVFGYIFLISFCDSFLSIISDYAIHFTLLDGNSSLLLDSLYRPPLFLSNNIANQKHIIVAYCYSGLLIFLMAEHGRRSGAVWRRWRFVERVRATSPSSPPSLPSPLKPTLASMPSSNSTIITIKMIFPIFESYALRR